VYLPRNDRATEVEAPAAVAATSGRGDETLLLVDDEQVVRIVAETVLRGHGYRIMTAADGHEAIETFRAYRGEISLVLMDMTMPRMSGLEAFRAMRAIDAWVPVVICSGYVVDLNEFETPEGDRPNGFVQKPYHLQDLVTTVRATIDAAGPRPPRPPGPSSGRLPALAK
jgi:CheY-like chemotaxis protein